jgi:hypothetical protein
MAQIILRGVSSGEKGSDVELVGEVYLYGVMKGASNLDPLIILHHKPSAVSIEPGLFLPLGLFVTQDSSLEQKIKSSFPHYVHCDRNGCKNFEDRYQGKFYSFVGR